MSSNKLNVLLLGVSPEIKAILEDIADNELFYFIDDASNLEVKSIIRELGAQIPDSLASLPFYTINKPARIAEIIDWLARACVSIKNQDINLSEIITLDVAQNQLKNSLSGEVLQLTDKEAKLCEALAISDDSYGKDDLLQEVWGYGDNIETRTLETHANRLRKKLEQISGDKITISSTKGGYILELAQN